MSQQSGKNPIGQSRAVDPLLRAKKILLIVLIAVLLVAPTVFASIYVYTADHSGVHGSMSVVLSDSTGREYAEASGTPNTPSTGMLVTVFHDLITHMTPISELPDGTESLPYITARITKENTVTELRCYFSFAEVDSFCVDGEGRCYSIRPVDNEIFLNSSFAEPLYLSAKAPALYTADGEEVIPSSVAWTYTTASGQLREAVGNQSTEEVLTYDVTGEIGIAFSVLPDVCSVKAYENGEEVFRGDPSELPSLILQSGNELTLNVQAVWGQENHSSSAYGELSYSFRVRVRNRTDFTVSSEELTAGSAALLTCTNVTDPRQIRFSTDARIPSPVFFADGDLWRALLVFPMDSEPGVYDMTLSYGASSEDFRIILHATVADSPLYGTTVEGLPDLMPLWLQEWRGINSRLPSQAHKNLYFRGNFLDPSGSEFGYERGYTHGGTVSCTAYPEEVTSAFGNEYLTDPNAQSPVPALHHGQVIEVGSCMLLGNYAVLDHGGGLRSWYGGLDRISVSVGEALHRGETVGTAGGESWTGRHGFLIALTVYDTLLDPALLLGDGKEISFDYVSRDEEAEGPSVHGVDE